MVPSSQDPPNAPPESPALIHPLNPETAAPPAIQAEEYFKHQGYDPNLVNFSMTQQVESRESMLLRHEREQAEHFHQRNKEYLGYGVGIVLITVLMTSSLAIVCNKNTSSDEKGWARTVLTSVATAVGGYMFGKGKAG
jgi:cation transport ATPase